MQSEGRSAEVVAREKVRDACEVAHGTVGVQGAAVLRLVHGIRFDWGMDHGVAGN